MWKGFARNAQQGLCTLYWNHVKDNICNGDLETYEYLRKWLAYVFQHPDVVHTGLVLCGSQGVGKNSFVEPLGVLLGSHYAPLSSINELVSNFNFHLKNAVLIHANEAVWGGNRKELGTLKAMITEQTCLIEGKGKDRIVVRNFKHVIISSNEDWPVHLDPDDRRFLVLRVSEKHKEDHEYFKAIQNELNNGGYEALLFDLLHEDLTNFNPRRMPSSADSFSIKMRSTESPDRYLYEALCAGGFSIGENQQKIEPVWQGPIPKDLVYQDYVAWCEKSHETVLTHALFGRAIRKILITLEDTRPSGNSRMRCYKFSSLKQAQEEFCKAFKEKPERIFDNYESDYAID
jgi:phage/plasmid-associated DNA primase